MSAEAISGALPSAIVASAFESFLAVDLEGLRRWVDAELEWTYIDPTFAEPTFGHCRGRQQIEQAASRWASMGLFTTLEILEACGQKVLVVLHAPGLDAFRAHKSDDRNFHVVEVRGDQVASIRACATLGEARVLTGLDPS